MLHEPTRGANPVLAQSEIRKGFIFAYLQRKLANES